jgi:hypothetical protein
MHLIAAVHVSGCTAKWRITGDFWQVVGRGCIFEYALIVASAELGNRVI